MAYLPVPVEPQRRDLERRLDDDRPRHLRLPNPAVAKRDRDLDDVEPRAHRAVGHLDLKRVALRADGLELDALQGAPSPALEPARHVPDPQPEHGTGVGAAPAADRAPPGAP